MRRTGSINNHVLPRLRSVLYFVVTSFTCAVSPFRLYLWFSLLCCRLPQKSGDGKPADRFSRKNGTGKKKDREKILPQFCRHVYRNDQAHFCIEQMDNGSFEAG